MTLNIYENTEIAHHPTVIRSVSVIAMDQGKLTGWDKGATPVQDVDSKKGCAFMASENYGTFLYLCLIFSGTLKLF